MNRLLLDRWTRPLGKLWMACSEQGVCKLVFPVRGAKAMLERWLALYLPNSELTATNTLLEQARAELGEYFAGYPP